MTKEKYEMCLQLTATYLAYAEQQKANGSDGWMQSLYTAVKMEEMAFEIKRELDANNTIEYKMAA
jgi:hypothetical protein